MQFILLLLIIGCTSLSSYAQDFYPDLSEDNLQEYNNNMDIASLPALQQDLYGGVWDSETPLNSELIYVENDGIVKRSRVRGGKREGAAGDRYVCRPSREDVVRLLLALHDARGGNSARTVNFCNRRRPATNILTNLRFLGRRR